MKLLTTATLLLLSTALSAESGYKYYYKNQGYDGYRSPRESVWQFLKAYGSNYQQAFFDAAKFGYNDLLEPLIDLGARINGRNKDGKTALAFAAEKGNVRTCALLIEMGAHVDARTNWGSTPLMWAAQNGHKDACKVLLRNGANINAKTNFGKTALDYARGYSSLVNFLRKAGAQSGSSYQSSTTTLQANSDCEGGAFVSGVILGSLVTCFLNGFLQ